MLNIKVYLRERMSDLLSVLVYRVRISRRSLWAEHRAFGVCIIFFLLRDVSCLWAWDRV